MSSGGGGRVGFGSGVARAMRGLGVEASEVVGREESSKNFFETVDSKPKTLT